MTERNIENKFFIKFLLGLISGVILGLVISKAIIIAVGEVTWTGQEWVLEENETISSWKDWENLPGWNVGIGQGNYTADENLTIFNNTYLETENQSWPALRTVQWDMFIITPVPAPYSHRVHVLTSANQDPIVRIGQDRTLWLYHGGSETSSISLPLGWFHVTAELTQNNDFVVSVGEDRLELPLSFDVSTNQGGIRIGTSSGNIDYNITIDNLTISTPATLGWLVDNTIKNSNETWGNLSIDGDNISIELNGTQVFDGDNLSWFQEDNLSLNFTFDNTSVLRSWSVERWTKPQVGWEPLVWETDRNITNTSAWFLFQSNETTNLMVLIEHTENIMSDGFQHNISFGNLIPGTNYHAVIKFTNQHNRSRDFRIDWTTKSDPAPEPEWDPTVWEIDRNITNTSFWITFGANESTEIQVNTLLEFWWVRLMNGFKIGIENLTSNTTYSFQVNFTNSHNGSTSKIVNFTTLIDPEKPIPPEKNWDPYVEWDNTEYGNDTMWFSYHSNETVTPVANTLLSHEWIIDNDNLAYHLIVTNLQPNTSYSLSITFSNEHNGSITIWENFTTRDKIYPLPANNESTAETSELTPIVYIVVGIGVIAIVGIVVAGMQTRVIVVAEPEKLEEFDGGPPKPKGPTEHFQSIRSRIIPSICEENRKLLDEIIAMEKKIRLDRDDGMIGPKIYERLIREIKDTKAALQGLVPLMKLKKE